MKIKGYIEVTELDLNDSDCCDGSKYPHPGLYWLPNAYGGSYALVHSDPPNFAVFTIAVPKDHLKLKYSITTKASKSNPYDPPIMPKSDGDLYFNPCGSFELHSVISTDIFLKALALAMNQNTENSNIIEEILK